MSFVWGQFLYVIRKWNKVPFVGAGTKAGNKYQDFSNMYLQNVSKEKNLQGIPNGRFA